MLASVLLPGLMDMIKNGLGAVTRKWIGVSVDDQIKMQNADIEKLKALAALDTPSGTPSQWVIDLRASSRYIGVGVCLLAGVYLVVAVPNLAEIGSQLIGIPFSFLFGERMYLTMTGKGK
jgi:hypothetical protein